MKWKKARALPPTAALLVGALAAAAPPAELRSLFPSEADVFVPRAGLARLDLPPEVLASCRPDLSDLRMFDAAGREMPFLVDSRQSPGLAVERSGPAAIVAVRRQESRRESGPPIFREVYDTRAPSAPPPSGAWLLSAVVSRPRFVARVVMDGIGAGGAVTPLVRNGSLFRLGGAEPMERLSIEVPPFDGTLLRLTFESEEGGFLEPTFRFESGRRLAGASRISVPLAPAVRRVGEGRTILEAPRPRGVVPDLLRIVTTSGTFDRRVSVWDDGPGSGPGVLGTGRIYRVPAATSIEAIEIPLGPPRGDRVRVEIDDGDSPPLEGLALEAVVRRPTLVFDAPAGGDGAVAVLRFGGGRAYAPRYDLSALTLPAGRVAHGKRALALESFHDPAGHSEARLGPARPNPSYDHTPALAFAMRPGAKLDARRFRHRRDVRVAPSPEGLSRIRLAPADLAVLREDLADLRIADAQGQQWPYLLERATEADLVDLRVEGPERKGRASVYRLVPPVAPLSIDRLVLDPDAPYFDRPAVLTGRLAGREPVSLLGGRIIRPVGDPRPVSVDLPGGTRVDALDLSLDDGDDAALSIRSARARVPVAEVFLAAPAGDYALLLGSSQEKTPQYDLARVRDVVLAVAAGTATPGALAKNPEWSATAGLATGGGLQQVALWGALVAAVVTLLVFTLRLARR